MGDVFLYPWGWGTRDTYLWVINVCLQGRFVYLEEWKIFKLREKYHNDGSHVFAIKRIIEDKKRLIRITV